MHMQCVPIIHVSCRRKKYEISIMHAPLTKHVKIFSNSQHVF